MKKNIIRCLKFGLPLITAAVVPSVISSCSSASYTYTKALTSSTWSNNSTKYSDLSSSKVSAKSAAYGSNYNNGNYIFIWGSLGTDDGTTASSLASFLYGTSASAQEQNINSSFLTQFFGNSGIGNGKTFGYSVSVLMYIDIPPYDGTASSINGKSGYDSPNAQYSLTEVLNEANKGSTVGAYSESTLPVKYQLKVGTYKRTDKQAIAYREFIDYLTKIRPSLSSPQSGGMIAFKKNKNPQAISSLTDASSVISTLQTYYTPTTSDS